MWKGEKTMRLVRAFIIVGVLAGVLVAAAGAVGAVSAWRRDVDRTALERQIADARTATRRERAAITNTGDLRVAATRHKVASAFGLVAYQQSRLLGRLIELSPSGRGGDLAVADSLHDQTVALVSRGLAPNAVPGTRPAQLAQAQGVLRAIDARLRAASVAVSVEPWPSGPFERLEAFALAIVAAMGVWRFVQIARRLAGLRLAIENPREIERLHDAAHTDSLTGLGNHRTFYSHLAREIKQRAKVGSTFSLLAIDLDGLKRVNDEQGHLAGDEYIKTVAHAIRMEVDRIGSIYRTGGDEFMALLPNRRAWSALAIAHNIQRAATEATGQRALSVGVTESANTESARALINQADIALYEAKRNKLLAVIYRPALEASSTAGSDASLPTPNQRTLAAALAHAIDAKDSGERNHCETVAELSVGIGQRVGIPAGQLERLRLAGLVHDVGKIGLPGRDPAEAGGAGVRGADGARAARDDRPRDSARGRSRHRGGMGSAPSRALRRCGLSGRARRRGDPAGVTRACGRRRVRDDDRWAAVPESADDGSGARRAAGAQWCPVRPGLRRGARRPARPCRCVGPRPGA